MAIDVISTSLYVGVIAKTAITWTPVTFYVLATIVHTLMILLLFKLLHVPPEHNSFLGALIAAAAGNAAGYFLGEYALMGNLATAAIYFTILAAISSGEVAKSVLVFAAALGVYAGLGMFLTPRTPLTPEKIGGLPQVVMTGGFTAEPISKEESDELMKSGDS